MINFLPYILIFTKLQSNNYLGHLTFLRSYWAIQRKNKLLYTRYHNVTHHNTHPSNNFDAGYLSLTVRRLFYTSYFYASRKYKALNHDGEWLYNITNPNIVN